MKRSLALFLAAVLTAAGTVCPVYAYEYESEYEYEYEEEAQDDEEDEDNYSVLLNNSGFINFTAQQPVNIEGRVFVPVRGVFEELGFEVDYDPETKTAYLANDRHFIEMTLGNEYFTVDDREVYPEVPQFILNKSFMIPIRAVAEAIGAVVGYNHNTKIITINYDIENTAALTTTEAATETTTEAAVEAETEAETETSFINFTINGVSYRFGQSTKIPNPTMKQESPFGFTWYIYNPNVYQYYMLGINSVGEIVAFYTQTAEFSFENLTKGQQKIKNVPSIDGYTIKYYVRSSSNSLLDGRLYALFVCDDSYIKNVNYSDDVLANVKEQLYLMMSAFRANEGAVDKLEFSKYTVSQQHTDDLSVNNGNASVSLSQRMVNTNVYLNMPDYGLFETGQSAVFYFDILDAVLSNDSAYQDLIYGGFYEIDRGLSYNEVSNTLYYAHILYVNDEDYYDSSYNYR
ncbi:MAG: copper amine oxidase N-terminal domain-containing protein [Clostridiales bacterium]|nr:copper amine oxidase N-terminal domain-containing protein [Clostridiales bacterium]MCD8215126.1 copper amine oxidase N-terminal domain-containing protein [Clostridiales bacterium]